MQTDNARWLVWIAPVLLIFVQACAGVGGAAADASVTPESEDEKTLYALGLSMGGNISGLGLTEREIAIVKAGLSDAATGAEPKVELQAYRPNIGALINERRRLQATKSKGDSKDFMDQIARADGAESSSSGMVYIELQAGTGEFPKLTDTVQVHYSGTLTDGTKFDSSYDRGEPAQFRVQGVIPCWTEALQKMRVGGKAKVVCPPSIAYGDSGRPGIPPGATLVFEVELLDITG